MKKGKSITLLSIIGIIMAFLIVMTFVKFPVGVKNYNGILGAIDLDYDLAGGTSYTLTLSDENSEEVEDITKVTDTISYRLRALGYDSFAVKTVKEADDNVLDYDIVIEARGKINKYGEEDVDTLTNDIAVVAAYGEIEVFGGSSQNPTEILLEEGKVIESAVYTGATLNNEGDTYYTVSITFTPQAFEVIKEGLDAGSYYLSIKLGNTELLSGATALSASYFSNRTLPISTGSEATAKQSALQISSGGLAYKYEISEGVSVSSPYGENISTKLAVVIVMLFVLVIAALIVIFKGYGVVSALSMILFMLLDLIMLIAVPNIRLSIGGIVGIILSIVLVADGLIIISKRISEEYANGKTVKACIKTGLKRSLFPVLNICVVSIIVSLLLIIFTFGSLKNFGIVFAIGSVIALITDLLFIRMFLSLFVPLFKKPETFFRLKRKEEIE